MSYLCVGFSKTVKPVYEICCFVPLWQSLTCELQCEECNTAIVPPHFDCRDTLWVWWFILTASLRQIQRVNQILRFADTREWQLSDFMARPRADAWRPLRNWSKNQLVCHLSSNTSLYLLLRHLWDTQVVASGLGVGLLVTCKWSQLALILLFYLLLRDTLCKDSFQNP